MRKEMDELTSAMREKTTKSLDGMIKMTDSPFTTEVLNHPLPPKFRISHLKSFNSLKDSLDHIESFKMLVHLQMTQDEVICRAFLTTLKDARRVWFSKIPLGTIANFEQLSHSFVRHFIGGQRHRKPMRHLLIIKEEEGELLRLYATHFNKEVLQVDVKVAQKIWRPKVIYLNGAFLLSLK